MSQKIYLDDCAYAKDLVRLLEAEGHQETSPKMAGIGGHEDQVHFRFAADHGMVLLSKNPDDFLELHQKDSAHGGIFLVYQDNDPNRNMSHQEIAKAIGNLEQAGISVPGSCHVLNAWRY